MTRQKPTTKDELRAAGCFNDHALAGHGTPYIAYRAADNGRGGQCAAWQVHRPGYKTHPTTTDPETGEMRGNHRRNNDAKTFDVHGRGDRAPKLEAAMTWCAAQYGITAWARTPWGGYMAADVYERRIAEIRASAAPTAAQAPMTGT